MMLSAGGPQLANTMNNGVKTTLGVDKSKIRKQQTGIGSMVDDQFYKALQNNLENSIAGGLDPKANLSGTGVFGGKV